MREAVSNIVEIVTAHGVGHKHFEVEGVGYLLETMTLGIAINDPKFLLFSVVCDLSDST